MKIFKLAALLAVSSSDIILRCRKEGLRVTHLTDAGPGLQASIREWFTRPPTLWLVVCPTHGKVRLSDPQYDEQMAEGFWWCPVCDEICVWSDELLERWA